MLNTRYDYQVNNFRVRRRGMPWRWRDALAVGGAILMIILLAVGFVYIPSQIVALDYEIEVAKVKLNELQEEEHFLTMRESELTSAARLEAESSRLGLQPVADLQIRYFHLDEGSSRLARNPRVEGDSFR